MSRRDCHYLQHYLSLFLSIFKKDISRYLTKQKFPITRQTFNCTSPGFDSSDRVPCYWRIDCCSLQNDIGDGIDNTKSHQQEVRCVLVNHVTAGCNADSSFQLQAPRITYDLHIYMHIDCTRFMSESTSSMSRISSNVRMTFAIFRNARNSAKIYDCAVSGLNKGHTNFLVIKQFAK